MLEDLITDEELTLGNRNLVLNKKAEKTMQRILRENEKERHLHKRWFVQKVLSNKNHS